MMHILHIKGGKDCFFIDGEIVSISDNQIHINRVSSSGFINLEDSECVAINNCRIMGEDESIMQARLSLSLAVKQVIKNILDMLKITCPESM